MLGDVAVGQRTTCLLFMAFSLNAITKVGSSTRVNVQLVGARHDRTGFVVLPWTRMEPTTRTSHGWRGALSLSPMPPPPPPNSLDMTDRMVESWKRVALALFDEAAASGNSTVKELQRVLVQRGYDFDTFRRRFDLMDTTWTKLSSDSNALPTLAKATTTSTLWNGTRFVTLSQHEGDDESTVTTLQTTRFLQEASLLEPHEWEDDEEDPSENDYDSAWMGFQEKESKAQPTTTSPLSEIHPQDDILIVEREVISAGKQVQTFPRELYGRSYEGRQILISPLQKVPGCIANVWVRTRLLPMVSADTDDDSNDSPWFFANRFRVLVDGEADALISRGLLALVTDALYGTCIHQRGQGGPPPALSFPTGGDVLSIAQPSQVAQALQLQPLLSPGRNDGLASMVQTIQQQVQALLQERQQQILQDMTKKKENDGAEMQQPPKVSLPVQPLHQPDSSAPRVALLLSGGVDSSVALHWLVRQGYNVTAFYLRIWLQEEDMAASSSTVELLRAECPWEEDYVACLAVCEPLGVPLRVLSLQEEYHAQVVSYTIQEAQRGRTPNPDVLCNSCIKFGCFLDSISPHEFDWVASGHYAQTSTLLTAPQNTLLRRKEKEGVVGLYRSVDSVKDQSYFLATLRQDQLRRILFPIGQFSKDQVRQMAQEWNLPNAHRPDSQGLCFLGKVKFDDFLESYLGTSPGPIVDSLSGKVLGHHRGLWFHTVGQRKGLGPWLFPQVTSRGPFYVVAKDPARNVVFVSNQYEEETFATTRTQFVVEDIAWIGGGMPTAEQTVDGGILSLSLDMKIRHGPRIAQGTLQLKKKDSTVGQVTLEKKDIGLAPGQFVVFYAPDTQECLGSSVISEEHWSPYQDYRVIGESLQDSTLRNRRPAAASTTRT